MIKHDWLSAALLWTLCGLSAATSGVGLWWIFDNTTEVAVLSIAYAAAATTLLQALIVYFWDRAASGQSLIRAIVAGLFGVMVSLLSAGFASGSYTYMFNKSGLEAYQTTQNAGTLTKPVADFGRSVRSLAMQMDDISNAARRKADDEERIGGTCLGDRPETNCGPKCRLRQRHAHEGLEMAKVARGLADEAVGIISVVQGDPSREGMANAFRSAQNLSASPALSRIASWLRHETEGFNGQFVDVVTGRSFVCRDPALQKDMQEALAVITAGFDLPDLPPEPAEIGFKDAIGKSYGDALQLAWMLVTGHSDPEQLESVRYSYGGYAPALVVEFLIIVLVFFRALARRDRGCDWSDQEIFGAQRRDLPPAVRRRNDRWVTMILASLIEDRKKWYIARPIDGSPDITAEWARMVLILKLPVDPVMSPAIPLADLYPEWVASRAQNHGEARWFSLHPITRRQREWLRRAAADLEANVNGDPQPPQPDSADGNVVDLSRHSETSRPHSSAHWRPVLGIFILLAAATGSMPWSAGNWNWQNQAAVRDKERLIKVNADSNGHFLVTAKIEGLPIQAMVDTGATAVILTYEDAERLNLNRLCSMHPSNWRVHTCTS